jgi:membrane protein implicated in regulation of membrane protease activity
VSTVVTLTFLVIGGVGLLILLVAVFGHDFVHHDVDGPISLPSIGAFVGTLGFAGAAVAALAGGGALAALIALGVGVVAAIPAAWGALLLSRAVARMPTDGTPTRSDLIGRIGIIVTPIPAGGYGEVRIAIGGQPVKFNARADRPVDRGAQVFVIEAPSDTSVVVEPTQPTGPVPA